MDNHGRRRHLGQPRHHPQIPQQEHASLRTAQPQTQHEGRLHVAQRRVYEHGPQRLQLRSENIPV